jgi:hypothetical protein
MQFRSQKAEAESAIARFMNPGAQKFGNCKITIIYLPYFLKGAQA